MGTGRVEKKSWVEGFGSQKSPGLGYWITRPIYTPTRRQKVPERIIKLCLKSQTNY